MSTEPLEVIATSEQSDAKRVLKLLKTSQPNVKAKLDPDRPHVICIEMIAEDELNLSALPDRSIATLDVTPAWHEVLTVRGTPDESDVTITLKESGHADKPSRMHLIGCRGALRLDLGGQRIGLRTEDSTVAVECGPGSQVDVGVGFARDQATLTLRNAQGSILCPVWRLWISGATDLYAQEQRREPPELEAGQPRIDVLVVEGTVELQHDRELRIDRAVGVGRGVDRLHLKASTYDIGNHGDGPIHFKFEELRQLELAVVQPQIVVSAKSIHRCTTTGKFTLDMPDGSAAYGLHLGHPDDLHDGPSAILRAGPNSVLVGVTGRVALADAEYVHLASGDMGLTLYQAPSRSPLVDQLTPAWKGMDITGVRLPPGMTGRQVLANMGDVFHFEPDIRGVPGLEQTVLARATRTPRPDYPALPAKLSQDLEFTRELARLSKAKGAPGSVSTKLAWCAYRLRAKRARGLVEKSALWIYRLIGYGERPMPAFLTWIAIALCSAALLLGYTGHGPDLTLGGLRTLAEEAGRLAVGPFAGVGWGRPTDVKGLEATLEVIARVIISVPLVTGSLALRKYVKDGAVD